MLKTYLSRICLCKTEEFNMVAIVTIEFLLKHGIYEQ